MKRLVLIFLILIITSEAKFRQKSRKLGKYKKIVRNESVSMKDKALLRQSVQNKKQPSAMSFKSLSGRIIMVKDKE